jgi:hypothetical protein
MNHPFYNGGGMHKVPLADPTVYPNLALNLGIRSNTFYNATNTTDDPTAGQLFGGVALLLLPRCDSIIASQQFSLHCGMAYKAF